MRKYEFTGQEKVIDNTIILKRIRRCVDGLEGGWIESEDNLAQEGACFVFNESSVLDYARVEGDAQIMGDSVICDFALIKGRVKAVHCLIGGDVIIDSATGTMIGLHIKSNEDIERGDYGSKQEDYTAA